MGLNLQRQRCKLGCSNLHQHCHLWALSSLCSEVKMTLLQNRKLRTQINTTESFTSSENTKMPREGWWDTQSGFPSAFKEGLG